MTTESSQKNDKKYVCEKCNYITSKKCNYDKHLLSSKHATCSHDNQKVAKSSHECNICNKYFNDRAGLWRHKKKCSVINSHDEFITPPPPTQPSHSSTEDMQMTLILELVKQNQEFKDLLMHQSSQMMEQNKTMIEVAKNSQINNTINNNTISNSNNNNKTFNLQFFLNETCTNAMNMSEFIETIEVQMNELENIGHNGYVAGMTDIILSRIKDLDVSKRPVHCTDLKRETMYIKDHNEWNKDTAEKSYLRKAISMVSKKNYGKTMEWRERNPECLEIGSPKYDFCFKMMRNVLGDFEDVQFKMDNKIIKSLAKEVVVDR